MITVNVKVISNEILMNKVVELKTTESVFSEQILKEQIQIGIITKAFGVKNNETNELVVDYDRERVLTDSQIEKELNEYIRFYQWAKESASYREHEYKRNLYYFIEAVEFFDKELALEFYRVAQSV